MRELLPAAHIFYAVKANPADKILDAPRRARLQVRHRLARRDRAGAGRRRRGRPHLLRQHHQEGEGHRLGLPAGRAPVRLRQRGRAAEARPRRAGRQGVLPRAGRLRRRRVAAQQEVRLRAGDGQGPAAQGQGLGARCLRHLLPCRQPADRPRPVGPGARPRSRRCSSRSPRTASTCAWSTWAAASRRATGPRSTASRPTARR